MTDRLRRLDALFAERVLGLPIHNGNDLQLPASGEAWFIGVAVPEGTRYKPLPHYTRSLDAAWEGLTRFETNHEGAVLWRESGEYCAGIGDPDSIMFQSSSKANPAEALVLACLRACGVSEDELA